MSTAAAEHREFIADLRSTVRAALASNAAGSDGTAAWAALASQVGVGGLLVPEALGGLELGAQELVAVAEEIGSAAASVPFLSHAVAATVLLHTGGTSELIDDLLAGASSGERKIAVVRPTDHLPVVDASSGESRLVGNVPAVVDAPGADLLLVAAQLDGETVVCLVDQSAPGLTVTERSVLDLTRSIGSVSFNRTPATVLLAGADARKALEASSAWSRLALAADQVGLARRCLDITVEYVGIRSQFGAAIGSFQAIKHRCTDVLLELELAAALVDQAAKALDAGADPQDLVSTAALQATTAATAATDAMIQLHGGIGFTWEHVAHHYFRRARSNASLLGPTQALRDAVAASCGV